MIDKGEIADYLKIYGGLFATIFAAVVAGTLAGTWLKCIL